MDAYTKVDSNLNKIRRSSQFRPPDVKAVEDVVANLEKLRERYGTH